MSILKWFKRLITGQAIEDRGGGLSTVNPTRQKPITPKERPDQRKFPVDGPSGDANKPAKPPVDPSPNPEPAKRMRSPYIQHILVQESVGIVDRQNSKDIENDPTFTDGAGVGRAAPMNKMQSPVPGNNVTFWPFYTSKQEYSLEGVTEDFGSAYAIKLKRLGVKTLPKLLARAVHAEIEIEAARECVSLSEKFKSIDISKLRDLMIKTARRLREDEHPR